MTKPRDLAAAVNATQARPRSGVPGLSVRNIGNVSIEAPTASRKEMPRAEMRRAPGNAICVRDSATAAGLLFIGASLTVSEDTKNDLARTPPANGNEVCTPHAHHQVRVSVLLPDIIVWVEECPGE